MRTVADFPYAIRKEETVWIPMSDGARLAATVWMPESAAVEPVPAIVEYIPYRRRDFTAARDALHHPYFAGYGFASVRVDMRGSGDSDGLLLDEYLPQEQRDGVEVLRWLAAQPWCSGDIGMMGISWGGFNALQIAAHRPPELKAVIAVAATDDRYADDVHQMGGCLLGDNLSWASVMFAYNSLPPDPAVVGDRWREQWLERLGSNRPWLDIWLRHQRRDAYWRQASICDDYGAIRCPVMLVSGWADGYSNAVFRMLSNLDVPRRGLIGPWSHRYPHLGIPGPAIGFLQECRRWWNHWLNGEPNGVEREPMLRVWMQESAPPTTSYVERVGRWVAEDGWPSNRIGRRDLPLLPHRIGSEGETSDEVLSMQSPLALGLFAGKWCSYGGAPDLAHDQRREDGGALVFESDQLDEPLEMLGEPRVELSISADRPLAMIAARLSDVRPNGEATRITFGLLNLTHREDSRRPQVLEPGRVYRATVTLNEMAQSVPAGNRIRLSLSTSYWPMAWAPPEPVTLSVHCAESRLSLPVRPRRAEDTSLRPLEGPEAAAPIAREMIEPERHDWRVVAELARDVFSLEVLNDRGCFHLQPQDLTVFSTTTERYSCQGNDFLSLCGEVISKRALSRGDWQVRTETRTVLSSSASEFVLHADLDAYEGERRVFCRSWDSRIPRDFV